MLELGIDEITLVLQLTPDIQAQINPSDWAGVAEDIIDRFEKKADFLVIFGDKHLIGQAPSGYTVAYGYGEHNIYLAVAYHEIFLKMGVIVKFSAQALDYYLEASSSQVYELLKRIRSDFYTARLSRIDLTVDYIDEGIKVTEIYQNLNCNKIGVFREFVIKNTDEIAYRRCNMQYRGFVVGQDVPTIYLGSVKSNSELRIYDKRREQIERKGNKLDKAIKCSDWVRFEGIFKGEFAHQLSEELKEINSDEELLSLIAKALTQKFRLKYIYNGIVDCDTEYTQRLLDYIKNNNFILKTPSSRSFELTKSLNHMLFGSGIISTLYKIKMIWGNNAVCEMLLLIREAVDEYKPNDDVRYWLRKNSKDYEKNYPNFESFKRNNLGAIL